MSAVPHPVAPGSAPFRDLRYCQPKKPQVWQSLALRYALAAAPRLRRWFFRGDDRCILLKRNDPSQLVTMVMDEQTLPKSRRNGGKSPQKGL
jgi:hypothetical protein